MKRFSFLLLAALWLGAAGATAQTGQAFPYPALPVTLRQPPERLAWLLQHYWSCYDFTDTTARNLAVGEQGFVDYADLLQHADSALCARSAVVFADSIGRDASRQARFEELITRYLGSPRSPVYCDRVYAHLLRALPPTPQRTFLLGQVVRNLPGTVAADIVVDTLGTRLHQLQAAFILLVFADPTCDRCQELLANLSHDPMLAQQGVRTVVVDVSRLPDVHRHYYLPELPALYLLDRNKQVLLKNATQQQVHESLR